MGIRKSIAKGLHGGLLNGQRAFWHVVIDKRVDNIGKVQSVVTTPMPTNMSASNPWWSTVNPNSVTTSSVTTNTITLPATRTGTASITINANTPLSITASSATTSLQYTGTGTSNMLTSGYVWAPYIPVMNTFIYDSWDNLIRVREGLLEFTLFQAINPSAKTSASSSTTKSELSLYIENVSDKFSLSKRIEDARLGLLIPDVITEEDEVRLSKNVDSEFFCGWKVYECNFDGNSLFSPEKKSIQKSYNQNPDMPYDVYKAITAMKREIGDMLDRDYAFRHSNK